MKMKWQIAIVMALLMVGVASASICEYRRDITENCTMLSPHLTCGTYDYSIYNMSGAAVQEDTLTLLNASVYFLNFTTTLGEGDYIVRLCDNSTREVRVKEDEDNMIIAAIILLPMILAIMLVYGALKLSDDHVAFKIGMFLLSPIFFFTSLHFGTLAIIKFYNFPALQNAIGSTVYWFGIVFGVIVSYFVIYLIAQMFHAAAQKEDARLRYGESER